MASTFGVLKIIATIVVGIVFVAILHAIVDPRSGLVAVLPELVLAAGGGVAVIIMFWAAERLFVSQAEILEHLHRAESDGEASRALQPERSGHCPRCHGQVYLHDRGCPKCSLVFEKTLAEVVAS